MTPTKDYLPDLIYCGPERPTAKAFKPVRNTGGSKPDGGLWTSPLDSETGKSEWQLWTIQEDFGVQHYQNQYHIVPTEDCRILIADRDLRNMRPYIQNPRERARFLQHLDFERLAEDYDMVYFPEVREHNLWLTLGYDVPTGLFFNSDKFVAMNDMEYRKYKAHQDMRKTESQHRPETGKTASPDTIELNDAVLRMLIKHFQQLRQQG